MNQLTQLPLESENAFEGAVAHAELGFAKRAEGFPNHPGLADSPLHHAILIHSVFFAYCAQARMACRGGEWSLGQAARATREAWAPICDYYVARERGVHSEESLSKFRHALWLVVADDQRWRQHLSELTALAAGCGATEPPHPGHDYEPTGQSQASSSGGSNDAESRSGTKVQSSQPGKRKRGRPQSLPDEKKAAALKLKNTGGSNRDAAKILYSTKHPTSQQVKNTSTLLRIYREKTERSSREPSKDGG